MCKSSPIVYAVNDTYQIMVPVEKPSLMYVKVGDKCYFDHSNGIMRSNVDIHKMTVPQSELDREGKYTICERLIIERKPYFSETEDVTQKEYDFYPVKSENPRAYHISDAHSNADIAINAAKAYGKIDFLILNGDIQNHSGTVKDMQTLYKIASELTGGHIPVVFSRGNHDTRGIYAENMENFSPVANGKSYYTFRLGKIWGIVLDCAEDKADTNAEYGNTMCCHEFRLGETEFLKEVIKNAENEYLKDDVEFKMIVVHNPFTRKFKPPFDIEEDIYSQWAKMLRENIKPDIMICGHLHKLYVDEPGCENDYLGQPCTIVVGSVFDWREGNPDGPYFTGSGFEFKKDETDVTFTDSYGKTISTAKIKR